MKRQGTDDARVLFQTDNLTHWNDSLKAYDDAVKLKAEKSPNKTTKNLVGIDIWFRTELPKLIEEQKFLTSEQLCRVMDWKLKRGQFRPLMKRVESNACKHVQKVTKEALKSEITPDITRVKILADGLSGVGPATASAILSITESLHGEFPFMADEAVEKLAEKAKDLGGDWTAELIGRALWAHAIVSANGCNEQVDRLKITTEKPISLKKRKTKR